MDYAVTKSVTGKVTVGILGHARSEITKRFNCWKGVIDIQCRLLLNSIYVIFWQITELHIFRWISDLVE